MNTTGSNKFRCKLLLLSPSLPSPATVFSHRYSWRVFLEVSVYCLKLKVFHGILFSINSIAADTSRLS